MARDQVAGSFSGTGTTEWVFADRYAVSISGTFSATVKVQRRINGKIGDVATYTGAAEMSGENGANIETRLNCSAYTSGAVEYALVASAHSR